MTRSLRSTLALVGLALLIALGTLACTSTGGPPHTPTGGFASQLERSDTRSAPNPSAATPLRAHAGSASASHLTWATQGPLPPNEELWIISAPESAAVPNVEHQPVQAPAGSLDLSKEEIGAGALVVDRGGQFVPVPLEHTRAHANIFNGIASVDVLQRYANPYSIKIEAVYVFPLPQHSAVTGFVMTVGERKIRAVVRERREAEEIYASARAQGYNAALLTQERPNVFTQRVANIEPGTAIDIDITYFHTLPVRDGAYEFVFPMTVGPRYNPAGTTDPITATTHDLPPAPDAATTTYLRPGERSGHDVALTLDIHTPGSTTSPYSPTHEIVVQQSSADPSTTRIELAGGPTIANRDFVLRFRNELDALVPALATHIEDGQGYFALTLSPPADRRINPIKQPVEIIFVVDTSGSMNGRPLAQAKEAIMETLERLGPEDGFQIIRFANDASPLGDRVLDATEYNRREAIERLKSLEAAGGTEMLAGVRTALRFPQDSNRTRFVCFLTDGYIGNESHVLSEVHRELRSARLFSVGIGTSPNRFLIERLAVMGRGAAAYVGSGDSAPRTMRAFLQQVRHPVLTDVRIEYLGVQAEHLNADAPFDIQRGRPKTIMGRFDPDASPDATLRITGTLAGRTFVNEVRLADAVRHPAIGDLWARAHIAELTNRALRTSTFDPEDQIRTTALRFGLLSPYTAQLAVDASRVTGGDIGITTQVPTHLPAGMRTDPPERDR